MLAAACLFEDEVPVPRAAIAAAAGVLGVSAPDPALDRLLALGLVDDFGPMPRGRTWRLAASGGKPAGPPAGPGAARCRAAPAADAALTELAQAWRDDGGGFPVRPAGCRRLPPGAEGREAGPAASSRPPLSRLSCSCSRHGLAPAALDLAVPALERLSGLGYMPGYQIFGHTIRAAERVGEIGLQEQLLDLALRPNALRRGHGRSSSVCGQTGW